METVAVYQESKIRTYGFELQEGLNLWEMAIPGDQLAIFGAELSDVAAFESRFEWVVGHPAGTQAIHLQLLCDDDNSRLLSGWFDARRRRNDNWVATLSQRVDVLNFQGPHFGDRYGIVDYTITALAAQQITVLGLIVSVSGICLILPLHEGRRTKAALEAVFEIPNACGRKGPAHSKDSA